MRQHLSSAVWIVGGSALNALGTLVGVRILTQFLTPGSYGVVTLALGMSTLAISIVSTPLTQAAMHFYPAIAATGSVRDLLNSLQRCFLRMAPWPLGAAVIGGTAYVVWGGGSLLLVVLIVLLLACECWRSSNVSLLNAARRNRQHALWVTTDTWARPLVASAAVLIVGQSPIAVLTCYVVTSATLILIFSRNIWPAQAGVAADADTDAAALDARMWSYAIPLIPMGVIGWASNLGDRYIIGGVLGVADAGLYAAIYGMSYAPFMLVGTTVELALRPVHQAAVSKGDHARARELFRMWVVAVAGICAVGVVIYSFGHEFLATLFVGKNFRSGSNLMPWIGAGYALRATSYVFERVCYAYGQTRRVLTVQLLALVATVIASPLGVLTLGLKGAAMALPVYFSVQLVAAIYFANRTLREATTGSSVVGAGGRAAEGSA